MMQAFKAWWKVADTLLKYITRKSGQSRLSVIRRPPLLSTWAIAQGSVVGGFSKRPRQMLPYHLHSILSGPQVSQDSEWGASTPKLWAPDSKDSWGPSWNLPPHYASSFFWIWVMITNRQVKDLRFTLDTALSFILLYSVHCCPLRLCFSNMFWIYCFIKSTATTLTVMGLIAYICIFLWLVNGTEVKLF